MGGLRDTQNKELTKIRTNSNVETTEIKEFSCQYNNRKMYDALNCIDNNHNLNRQNIFRINFVRTL